MSPDPGLLDIDISRVALSHVSHVTGDVIVGRASHFSAFGADDTVTVDGAVDCDSLLDTVTDAALLATGGVSATCTLVD